MGYRIFSNDDSYHLFLRNAKSMKVLFIVPSFNLPGGVANHYIGLTPFWTNEYRYVTCGRRRRWPAYLTLVPDWINLFFRILFFRPKVVVVNTSFKYQPVFRDAVNILIAKMLRRKVVTFVHGWDQHVYKTLEKHHCLFSYIYNKNEYLYVLYSAFKEQLVKLGIKTEIKLTTTKVADELVEGYTRDASSAVKHQLLFLARADYDKGLDTTLEAFSSLKSKLPNLKLCVCGDGPYLSEAKQYVETNGLKDVTFKGYIGGEEKKQCFTDSDIYILPTTHGEGMATSLLEAMAMGLTVISRPVGGVVDFFEQEKMGYLLESTSPADYVDVILRLYQSPERIAEIGRYNHEYACSHFLASSVARAIEADLNEIK